MRDYRELLIVGRDVDEIARHLRRSPRARALARGPNAEGPTSAEFLPDGTIVWQYASALVRSDPATGETLASIDTIGARAMAVAPARGLVAVGGFAGSRHALWLHALDDLRVVREISWRQAGSCRAVGPASRPSRRRVTARRWRSVAVEVSSTSTASVPRALDGPRTRGSIACAAFLGEGALLATGTWDDTISLWDVARGERGSSVTTARRSGSPSFRAAA